MVPPLSAAAAALLVLLLLVVVVVLLLWGDAAGGGWCWVNSCHNSRAKLSTCNTDSPSTQRQVEPESELGPTPSVQPHAAAEPCLKMPSAVCLNKLVALGLANSDTGDTHSGLCVHTEPTYKNPAV